MRRTDVLTMSVGVFIFKNEFCVLMAVILYSFCSKSEERFRDSLLGCVSVCVIICGYMCFDLSVCA